jgi:ATP-dependent exoDNAse (exonuclease V) beta subunit
VRDDESDPGGRIYRDEQGEVYHSVTRILKETSESKHVLEAWMKRLGEELAGQERDQAAERGTRTHNAAEYVLKTAKKLSERAARSRGVWLPRDDGLYRVPAPLTQWAIRKAIPSAPKVGLSARGYKRSLLSWIGENVTCIHAIEFGINHPLGFAGTCDGLVDINGKLSLVDWKTSFRKRSPEMLIDYRDQLGAYSLGLKHILGLQVQGAAVVVARRVGSAQVELLTREQLDQAEDRYQDRVMRYWEALLNQGVQASD